MTAETEISNVTLAVLAGGEGRRMGFPKGHLRINDQPILAYLHEKISWPGPTLVVTAPGREHPPGAELYHAEAVDPVEGQGPLRGVLTALQHATTHWTVITTVDMPLVGVEQLNWLVEQSLNSSSMGLMLQRNIDDQLTIEPFPFACSIDAAEMIAQRLSDNRRSVQSLAQDPGFILQQAPQHWLAQVWTNLNSPEDCDQFLSRE